MSTDIRSARSAPVASAGVDAARSHAHLKRVRALATLMDNAYLVPGTNFRIGWDSILGLLPGVGDVATSLVSASIIGYAMRLGVRKRVLVRMLANVGLDLSIGAIPIVGDLFDATFKANVRNVTLIERDLARRLKAMPVKNV